MPPDTAGYLVASVLWSRHMMEAREQNAGTEQHLFEMAAEPYRRVCARHRRCARAYPRIVLEGLFFLLLVVLPVLP
jgi:hypothetical protein